MLKSILCFRSCLWIMLLPVPRLCATRQLGHRTSPFTPVTFNCRFLGRGEGRREKIVTEGTRWKSLYNCFFFFFSLFLGGSLILSQWLQCLVQSVFLYHLDIYWCYLTLETLLEGDGLSSIYFIQCHKVPSLTKFLTQNRLLYHMIFLYVESKKKCYK